MRLLLLGYFLLCRLHFLCAELPPPYNSLDYVRPFVKHGWYQNKRQLHKLIHEHQVKLVIEVGSWLGLSTIDIARTIPREGKVYAVDHWQGSTSHQRHGVDKYPWLPYLYEQFLSNIIHASLTDKVVPIRMDSISAAKVIKIHPDLIYIDASHDTVSVYKDLCAWYPYVQEKGILCGDDWSFGTVKIAVHRFAKEHKLKIETDANFWRLLKE